MLTGIDKTPDEFEAELQEVLAPAQLFHWLESAAGMRHCAAVGVAPEQAAVAAGLEDRALEVLEGELGRRVCEIDCAV